MLVGMQFRWPTTIKIHISYCAVNDIADGSKKFLCTEVHVLRGSHEFIHILQFNILFGLEIILHTPHMSLAMLHAEHLQKSEERLVALLFSPRLQELA